MKWVVSVVAGVPLLYFVFPFVCGFCNLSQSFLEFLVPIVLFGALASAIVMAKRVHGVAKLSRLGVGIVTWLATVAVFFVFPAGAKTWTLGFAMNFRLTKHPAQIQKWAVGILDRYAAGQLPTSTNAPYWAVGRQQIEAPEVPGHISSLWWDKPAIGIVTMTPEGWITDTSHTSSIPGGEPTAAALGVTHCIDFSWYLTGILVGRPDFRSTWNPWYIHEIVPGIYAYSGMK